MDAYSNKQKKINLYFYYKGRVLPLIIFLASFFYNIHVAASFSQSNVRTDSIPAAIRLADPTIFYHHKMYYLYGTGGRRGFMVYTSTDLKNWTGPAGKTEGYALVREDSYGTTGFWAPQVFYFHNKFYMAYTANENIAIAESDSPLGPFRQLVKKAISGEGKQIDPFVFIDDDGKKYLYHVRLTEGNKIFVAEMQDDLSDIKPNTVKQCITATEPWENTANAPWPVTEGPTVLKYKNLYYLFYSANDFRNIDYAVGYATATSPYGPWKKENGSPIISRQNIGINGTGHGDFLKKKNTWYYVFHTHASNKSVQPRITAIVKAAFKKDKNKVYQMVIDPKSFYYLSLHPGK